MSQKILGLSGAKQSGKTTSMNFLYGYQMRVNDVIEKFLMDDKGNLLVNAVMVDEHGKETEEIGILDVERRDQDFIDYAARSIWPHVRSFSFADPLKIIAIELFGLSEDQCYGTDEDKNSLTNIRVQDMSRLISGPDQNELVKIPAMEVHLTAREFLQYFGTDICRRLKSDVWVSTCMRRIKESKTELAIVSDCRFPNEIKAIKKAGGKVVRFTRNPHEDDHASETALEDHDDFDCVLDNANMSVDETNRALLAQLKEWEWLNAKI